MYKTFSNNFLSGTYPVTSLIYIYIKLVENSGFREVCNYIRVVKVWIVRYYTFEFSNDQIFVSPAPVLVW